MNITATLFGQMITFVIFVWFIKAYLWEPLTQAMEDRTNKISEGLASAELGEKRIEEANIEYKKIVVDAKQKASDVIAMAQQQSGLMILISTAQYLQEYRLIFFVQIIVTDIETV